MSFEEHIYTKYWFSLISAEKYITLKEKYFKEKFNHTSIEVEDECHLFFRIDLNTDLADIISSISYIMDLNNQFDKNIEKLKEEIENVINNFNFK